MNKDKRPIYIAVSSQKGGIGKSTVTTVLANYLHNVAGYNVGILDCDNPQHSILGSRNRELQRIQEDGKLKTQLCEALRKTGKGAFLIMDATPMSAVSQAESLIGKEPLDILFFDMPGTLQSQGVLTTLAAMDYIFIPVSADPYVTESALQFACIFRDRLMNTGAARTKEIVLFWTMMDKRERTDIYDAYSHAIHKMGFRILDAALPDSKRFRRELSDSQKSALRSTLIPPDNAVLKGSGIRELAQEIINIINEEQNI